MAKKEVEVKATSTALMPTWGKQRDVMISQKCTLTAVGMVIAASTTREEWLKMGSNLRSLQGALPTWIMDHEQFGKEHGYEGNRSIPDSLGVYIPPELRREGLTIQHYIVVRDLSDEKKEEWLDKAVNDVVMVDGVMVGIMTPQDLRIAVLQEQYENNSSQEFPKGRFDVIYADPPWHYEDGHKGKPVTAVVPYPTMLTPDICAMRVSDISVDNAVLFLWGTVPHMKDALQVLEAWGFDYRSHFVWVKDKSFPLGVWPHTCHEVLLIGVRGEGMKPLDRPGTIVSAKVRKHSQKPDEFYGIIEKMYPKRRYIELFARNTRPGWKSWGNDAAVSKKMKK